MSPPLTEQDDVKRFATLRAAAAMVGYQLWRTDPADGNVRYFASRWNVVRDIGDIDQVAQFVYVVGGA
ncbi:MAG: hypothetical protein Q7V20_05200 [Aquabacterium sp.]|uniref:hypothetical protein n=1 Tax=Aquabacterium sp. TaxID=1872578 RepID=UPI002720AECA|nr:hypothetical protein [Aquabacterium sp.]MDO9002831.1 hypothetical protein [Aquabacterium sp.]